MILIAENILITTNNFIVIYILVAESFQLLMEKTAGSISSLTAHKRSAHLSIPDGVASLLI